MIVENISVDQEVKEHVNLIEVRSLYGICSFLKKFPYLISRTDVFVLPFLVKAFPNALIETLACETPVVAETQVACLKLSLLNSYFSLTKIP